MHLADVDNAATRAGLVYARLRAAGGDWVDARELAIAAGETTCLSTWVSNVRISVAARGERVECRAERRGGRMMRWYRWVRAERLGEQMELAGTTGRDDGRGLRWTE